MTTTQKPKPVQKFQIGRIEAAIWNNTDEKGTRFNVTLSRSYSTENGKFGNSSSFGLRDLPLVIKVCDLAANWIYESQEEADDTAEAVNL
jgi:hypothetical protein